jgi:hypothetical protein
MPLAREYAGHSVINSRYNQRREPRGMFFALLDNAVGLPR